MSALNMRPEWPGFELTPLPVSPDDYDGRWFRADTLLPPNTPLPASVHDWVKANIRDTPAGEWQPPWKTLKAGSGSCIDKCILMRAMLIAKRADPTTLYVIVGHDQVVGEHAVLWFHGEIIDPLAIGLVPIALESTFTPEYAYSVDGFTYTKL